MGYKRKISYHNSKISSQRNLFVLYTEIEEWVLIVF